MCSLCSPPTNDVHDMFAHASQGTGADPSTDSSAIDAADDTSLHDTDLHGSYDAGPDTESYHFDAGDYHFDLPTVDAVDDSGLSGGVPDFF